MKFSVATVAAFAALVLAKPEFTNSSFNGVEEGKPFTLTWRNAQGTVTIDVITGEDEGSLSPVAVQTVTITTGESGSVTYTPSNLPSGKYAFRIRDESGDGPNYSKLIDYTGTGPVTTATSKTTTVTKTSTSASSTETTETETETTTQTSSVTTSASHSHSTTLTTSTSATSAPAATTAPPPPNNNNGQRFTSSLALVLGTVAALVFFN
ncbi:hypothetical protein QBC38DRAFT_452006 [Podospora fimiseda]|uniref:Extracellular matrix protein n=1 Tax=Podospora fimiseda TaxID=252190 RepID=A0AAN7H713_9PEZI|nr:hypothetical protein QBC38DRAFT_452006 [Podospora fimiseda]